MNRQPHRASSVAAAAKPKLLWVADQPAPPNVRQAAEGRWDFLPSRLDQPLAAQLRQTPLAVACPNGEVNDPRALERLLDAIDRAPAVAVVLLPDDAKVAWSVLARREGKFICIRRDAPPAELAAKIEAAGALQPAIRNLQAELSAARHLGRAGPDVLEDLDEEMRLAARLQRDFLPRRLPEVGPVRFAVLYRPLGWVSGDIYDVARLDETHVGFYVADAVGHGMPAALLTMFIKRALRTKRISGNHYEILPPDLSLAELNAAICEQNLSSCQFVTAVYCVLDVETGVMTYARAGHPEPLLLPASGPPRRLACDGSLLGVFEEEQYAAVQTGLSPGDRVVLYSDGIEDVLGDQNGDREQFLELIGSLAGRPREDMLFQLTAWIDEQADSARPKDDITVVVADMEG